MSGGVLERFQRNCGSQEAAEYDCTRHADAFLVQIEVRDAVLTQRDEWDAAEVSQRRVLEHHLGQLPRSVAGDAVGANAVRHGHGAQVSAALTVGIGCATAHLSEVIVVFVLRRSAMICAPSALSELSPRLRPRRVREHTRMQAREYGTGSEVSAAIDSGESGVRRRTRASGAPSSS